LDGILLYVLRYTTELLQQHCLGQDLIYAFYADEENPVKYLATTKNGGNRNGVRRTCPVGKNV